MPDRSFTATAAVAPVLGLLAGVGAILTGGFALDEVLPRWAAFAVITIAFAVGAAVAASIARQIPQGFGAVRRSGADGIHQDGPRRWTR
jgi:protein-S-isoprenylcysteine O-methyltransferase Ste14